MFVVGCLLCDVCCSCFLALFEVYWMLKVVCCLRVVDCAWSSFIVVICCSRFVVCCCGLIVVMCCWLCSVCVVCRLMSVVCLLSGVCCL